MEKISLAKFLSRCYHISNKNLSKMTHESVKLLTPDLKRCSFDFASKNQELLETGQIVMVEDCKGQVIPYMIPKIAMDEYENNEITIELDKKPSKIDITNLEELSNYELITALKRETRVGTLKRIKKELQERNISKNKNYKKERQNDHTTSEVDDYYGERYGKY